MTDVSADAAATLKAMEEVLAKYDGYPANDVRKARDAIKTRQVRRSREGIYGAHCHYSIRIIFILLYLYYRRALSGGTARTVLN